MRRVLKALLILAIGLPVLAAVGYWYLQQQIAQAGISQLQLDLNRLTLSSAAFNKVQFTLLQNGISQKVSLQNVNLYWQWPHPFRPVVSRLNVGPGQIELATSAGSLPQNDAAALTLPSQWQLPSWLPQQISISDLTLLLPCPAGTCQLQLTGHLSASELSDKPSPNLVTGPALWQSRLLITPSLQSGADVANTFILDASYQTTPQPMLTLTLQQDQQLGLSFKQQLNPDSQLAVTELALALSPPSATNQALLKYWGVNFPEAWLSQFQQPVQLYSKLNWQLPANGNLRNLLSSHDIDGIVIARAPDPFFLPQLGLVQGELNAELSMKDQVVERWQLNAEGTVTDMVFAVAVSDYDLMLNPVQFTLTAKATDPLNLNALPLQLRLSSSGGNSFNLQSELTVNLSANPRVDINKAQLTAAMATLRLADDSINLQNLQLNTELSGHWQADNWQVALADNSRISGAIMAEAFSASNVKLIANNSRFIGNQAGLTTLNSDINASITKLNQPALISQNWQWQGQLSGHPTNLALTGQLTNDAGLAISQQLNYQPTAHTLMLKWQLPETFLLASNPVAATFSDWPALLTLNKGKLTARGNLSISGNDINSSSQLQLGDIAGIYDRSLFAGLNAKLDITLADKQLQLQSTDFTLTRLNHGFEMGPLLLNATATLSLATPGQLKLNLQRAEMQAMDGTISANNQQLDFSQAENQLLLQLQQIDVASLLQQHPSNDLTGNGKLSGSVPLTINSKGLSVTDGNIAAEAPGGRLQYKSASTSAMATTNSNMKLVFDALENFHYTVLSSNISYDTNGKLNLGLTLQGSNPNLQQGRAINLNVNLEEDLPALITSLQLTNKLNDVITERVQHYLKQQQAAAAANGDKP